MKRFFITAIVCLVVVFNAFSENNGSKRPNIFFFFADDWGKYASTYSSFAPNTAFKTPALDKFAEEGVKFNNAHVSSPSCTPCRSALLSGQYFYRTGMGAILRGAEWDAGIPSYPLLLEKAGYHIGYIYKVWSPGTPKNAPYGAERTRYQKEGNRFCKFSQSVTQLVENGKSVEEAKEEIYRDVMKDFRTFVDARKEGQPYCYWFGPTNTHRSWVKGSGKALWGLDPDDLKGKMPEFLPDVHEIREDMCDYLGEVLALEEIFKRFMAELEATGEKENTLVMVSGDHGIPGFPRAKCNLYPFGTEVPLLVQWPEMIKGNRVIEDFVNLMDLAPTFLEAGNVEVPECMTGQSLLPLLYSSKSGQVDPDRNYVVTGRERHVDVAREGNLPYPQRAIQTKEFLYIRNFEPEREPMGQHDRLAKPGNEPSYTDLEKDTYAAYPDMDAGPTKAWMVKNRNNRKYEMHWRLGFEMRPEEELYDLRKDPHYLNNVASDPAYAAAKKELNKRLMKVLKSTGDPRITGDGKAFDRAPYVVGNSSSTESVGADKKTSKPNIILLMSDDMGFECLSSNGSTSYKTPVLDKLAKDGMRFTNCYSQPLCTPSRVKIMTGKYNNKNYVDFAFLDREQKTFGHVMQAAGYKTMIAGKWQLNGVQTAEPGYNDLDRPYQFGFDEYCLWWLTSKGSRFANPRIIENTKEIETTIDDYGPDIVSDYITGFIERNKDKPFFVYYPMLLVHSPFQPTPDSPEWKSTNTRTEKDNKYFKDMVEYTDKIVGKITDKLEELGLDENTIFIFTGDNGTNSDIVSQTANGAYPGGKGKLRDNGNHVPLVVRWPASGIKNSVNPELVEFSDFVPTLAEAGRTSVPEDVDGKSFYKLLAGEKYTPRKSVFVHYYPNPQNVSDRAGCFARTVEYKLYSTGKFFDMKNDKWENDPLDTGALDKKQKAVYELLKAQLETQDIWDFSVPHREYREPNTNF